MKKASFVFALGLLLALSLYAANTVVEQATDILVRNSADVPAFQVIKGTNQTLPFITAGYQSGDVFSVGSTGLVTAVSYAGDGSQLTGISGGGGGSYSGWITNTDSSSSFKGTNDTYVIGQAFDGGVFLTTNAIGSTVGGIVEDSGSVIQVQGEGSSAFGYATGGGYIGNIGVNNNGSFAYGVAVDGGRIQTTYYGASVWGYANGANSLLSSQYQGVGIFGSAQSGGQIIASSVSSFATGSAEEDGIISVAGAGAYAHGTVAGTNALISAAGGGAYAFGSATKSNAQIKAAGVGSFAGGVADDGLDSGTTIESTQDGNFAFGAGNVSATGIRASFAFGENITNDQKSFTVGYESKQLEVHSSGTIYIRNSQVNVDGTNGITDTKIFTTVEGVNTVTITRGIITDWSVSGP